MAQDKRIIALCGRACSGKTLLANYLVEKHGYKRVYVAQALKDLCSKLLNLSIEEMNTLKNVDKKFILNEDSSKLISEITHIECDDVCKELERINYTLNSTRHAFQFIGTDLIRKYNPNWHIKSMLSTMNTTDKYVVDDVRFPNEVQALQFTGCMLIFIVRPIFENISHHISEESIKWNEFKNLIINNKDADFAKFQLEMLLDKEYNEIAEKVLISYHGFQELKKSNLKIEVTNTNPAELTITERTVGWITQTYTAENNPLEIEDYKFYI